MVIAVTFFIFALLLGIAVIGRVPATLHTPLMSGANSIHGVVLVGVIIIAAESNSLLSNILVFFAALLGTLNVVGGYVVTDRMLEMFKPKKEVSPLVKEFGDEYDETLGATEISITEKIKDDPILARSVIVDEKPVVLEANAPEEDADYAEMEKIVAQKVKTQAKTPVKKVATTKATTKTANKTTTKTTTKAKKVAAKTTKGDK